ncbi:MAG: metal-sensing transcriptional repressor [Oscillospiraceae bacterium]|nr:metal-sensing transcriptional repressor [Oscillospiraceae bacterium]
MEDDRCCCSVSDSGADAECSCGERKKHRSEQEYKELMNRLKRIEGQVRGLQNMLESNAYCPDILVQVSAVNSALNSFSKTLLASHIKSCVVDDIRAGREETIDELVTTLQKVMK